MAYHDRSDGGLLACAVAEMCVCWSCGCCIELSICWSQKVTAFQTVSADHGDSQKLVTTSQRLGVDEKTLHALFNEELGADYTSAIPNIAF